ncbi:MAG: non-ribosomal peptide synthetase [Acidobacteria bacterium]|nr:MAG: non-ribosomal peptide synthetase [Acidobacteriota bacterium]
MLSQIEGYRLSPQQQHLWLLQQGGAAYLSQCAVRLAGKLNRELLREALYRVVNRHEILRTTFQRPPGIKLPVQAIGEGSQVLWRFVEADASSSRAEQEAEIEQLFQADRHQPFDYEHGPLLRATLLATAPQEHLLILCLPALCADSMSLNNLWREIAAAYAAGPEVAADSGEVVQYLQFSEWQNEIIADDDAQAGKEFWQRQVSATPLPLTLPCERPGAATASFEPCALVRTIEPELTARLRGVAARYDASLATLLAACWQTLLWRLTGQAEVVLGNVNDGRKYDELQGALGLLARALPIRSHFAEGLTFVEVLRATEQLTRAAHDWLEYFAWPHNTETAADLADTPFFAAAFECAPWPEPCTADGVVFSVVKQHAYCDRFKVKLNCFEQPDMLRLELHYDSQLLTPRDGARLAAQLQRLLASIAAEPTSTIGALDILDDDERRQLVIEFNDTAGTYPNEKCLHQLFEEQAARTPEQVAVTFEGRQLSYRELNGRANQLAAYLQTLGIGPEDLVAIYLERSPEMVVALLGVLKAGAAYVPLDLTYPTERLAFMLADAQVAVLLTQERLVAQFSEQQARIVSLDSDWPTIATQSEGNVVNRARPANAAYVIYTSGSTGKPKGVVIPQQGLVNYLSWCTAVYRVREGTGAPVHSPLGFDLTVTSLFAPLLSGRSIVLLPEEQGVEGLAATLRERGDFSLVKITPSHLEMLNQMLTQAELPGSARALIIGGEALTNETLELWRTYAPEVRLINEYGPTETVVGCCIYEVAAADPATGAVPIGRPIANMQVYLLDTYLRPVPVGVAGELYIGGAGLARAYLGQPQLTAERFVPNPFAATPGTRLYKTGDLARHLPDGNVEYLGRTDYQVKIRGFRIELGEIEAALWQHESVREAVVVARQDTPGDTRLIAYIVPQHGETFALQELRSVLRASLPDYMLPSAFITLKALPLTPNGKVDRRALPAPGRGSTGLEESYVAPRTPLEKVIAVIWAETVGVARVGIHDNFFELGGHSLLAMQVISRIREDFQVELPVRSIFNGMTVAEMAEAVLASEPEPGRSEKIARVLQTVEGMTETELLEALQQKRGANEHD